MITVFIVLFIIIIIIISATRENYENNDNNVPVNNMITNKQSVFEPIDNNYGRYYKLRY